MNNGNDLVYSGQVGIGNAVEAICISDSWRMEEVDMFVGRQIQDVHFHSKPL